MSTSYERFIYGLGGTSLELAELMNTRHEYISGFVLDSRYLIGGGGINSGSLNLPIISFEEYAAAHREGDRRAITISLGEPVYREMLSLKLEEYGLTEASISIGEFVSSSASIGCGTILHLGSIVSSNCSVGRSCFINKRVIIGHDGSIGDYSVISPSVSIGGHVSIGKKCFVGIGASIRDRVRIGDNVIIGMGSVVTGDIEDDSVAFGNPARVVRRNTSRKVFTSKTN